MTQSPAESSPADAADAADPADVVEDAAAQAPEVTPTEDVQLPPDIAALSYEAARDQLVEVVRRLESGQGGLEDSIGLWERGEMLARRCQQWLDGARERLDEAVSARRQGE
ncbi:exodeoxyribonuclease VII small subunit [Brachybacterium sacelli]|uniref:Exodeoxyribonuclease 7 small subunit n=1 Tax=Brachybacterium sacelli TaxID=173364 RepID=A0ABS4X478_9MICO|nr:exodeoxyribonuclease VII small subunit [Brachybacterium sacelli]